MIYELSVRSLLIYVVIQNKMDRYERNSLIIKIILCIIITVGCGISWIVFADAVMTYGVMSSDALLLLILSWITSIGGVILCYFVVKIYSNDEPVIIQHELV